MPKLSVEFYDLPSGEEPAKDFILTLEPKMRAKMLWTIQLLQQNGTSLRMPYSEALEDGIFELRAKVGSDISRVLYFFFVDNKAILTNGFIKKTQKTPEGEKDKARKYRAEYLSRKGRS